MKKAPDMITITKAEYDLTNWEATTFYEIHGVERITPEQLAKLKRLDKKANG
jgi:hypothetical protein